MIALQQMLEILSFSTDAGLQPSPPLFDSLVKDTFLRATAYNAKRAYAIAIPSLCLSVCLSVCPSHGWISQKQLKLASCSFHHTVAPSL